MPKASPRLAALLVALTAVGATGYCGFELGAPEKPLPPPGSPPSTILYPNPIDLDPLKKLAAYHAEH